MAAPIPFPSLLYPMPLGSVVAYAGRADPETRATYAAVGWLFCDGAAISRTDYADLYLAIGDLHGHGDGSTSFNLPDYRGRFLRGVDAGAGRDPDAAARNAPAAGGQGGDAVGSVQDDAFRSHQHPITEMVYDNQVDGVDSVTLFSDEHHNEPRATGVTGGSETRPLNAAVEWLILGGIPKPAASG